MRDLDDLQVPLEKQRELLEAFDCLADVLTVLANMACGDFTDRLPLDLPPTHPFGALCIGINDMIDALVESKRRSEDDQRQLEDKLATIESYRRELEDKLATIEQQRAAIRELSTPIIEVWEGVLCLPVIGIVDSSRGAEMTEGLLEAVSSRRARRAIIDVTGIDVMDTRTVDQFLRMAGAVKLLGAECVLTGVSPALAQTMVHIGVNVGIATYRTLRDALRAFVSGTLEDLHASNGRRYRAPA